MKKASEKENFIQILAGVAVCINCYFAFAHTGLPKHFLSLPNAQQRAVKYYVPFSLSNAITAEKQEIIPTKTNSMEK